MLELEWYGRKQIFGTIAQRITKLDLRDVQSSNRMIYHL